MDVQGTHETLVKGMLRNKDQSQCQITDKNSEKSRHLQSSHENTVRRNSHDSSLSVRWIDRLKRKHYAMYILLLLIFSVIELLTRDLFAAAPAITKNMLTSCLMTNMSWQNGTGSYMSEHVLPELFRHTVNVT